MRSFDYEAGGLLPTARTVREPTPVASSALFSATRSLTALDRLGIPCAVAGLGGLGLERLWSEDDGPSLLWPSSPGEHGAPVAAWMGEDELRIPIFGSVVSDEAADSMLARYGGAWAPVGALMGLDGRPVGSVWRSDDGSVFLPFDPDQVELNFLSERYREVVIGAGARRWRRLAMTVYYRVRKCLPKALQIWLRRKYAPIQARAAFPRWPIETGLHDLWDFLHSILTSVAGEPVPTIASWPSGKDWALVLTHDVETKVGLGAMDRVAETERELGFRSSWNFVPRRDYEVTAERVESLASAGFEVGVHGLHHDGRDLESEAMLRERLPGIRAAAERWNSVGFRSPATHRGWELMPLLGFEYDSSYPDTDPFEPQAGGCCTWLPFFNGEMVELPATMTQDHTLFVILRRPDESLWIDKAEFLRARGGMAVMVTHPDYLTDETTFSAYRRFLERYEHDHLAWKALPHEVNAWWRRRAASKLERSDAGWIVVGPAAGEAQVDLAGPANDWRTVLGAKLTGGAGWEIEIPRGEPAFTGAQLPVLVVD